MFANNTAAVHSVCSKILLFCSNLTTKTTSSMLPCGPQDVNYILKKNAMEEMRSDPLILCMFLYIWFVFVDNLPPYSFST